MRNKFCLFVIFFLVFQIVVSCGCFDRKYSKVGYGLGTNISLTVFTNKPNWKVDCDFDYIFTQIDILESKVSCNIDSSIVSKLNKQKKLDLTDDFTFNLIQSAKEQAKFTDGAFDPTIGNVLKLWNFVGEPKVPAEQDIVEALRSVGYQHITIEEKSRIVDIGDSNIDLGGIAKGAIVDKIAMMLIKREYNDFLINCGGDIYVKGKHGARAWRIAVADPFDTTKYIDRFELSDCAVVTSGDYERYFCQDDVYYHHILEPQTGYPVNNGVHSVTVITDNTMIADGLATAFFVMGPEKAKLFCEECNKKQPNFIKMLMICGNKDKTDIIRVGF